MNSLLGVVIFCLKKKEPAHPKGDEAETWELLEYDLRRHNSSSQEKAINLGRLSKMINPMFSEK